MAGMWPQAWVTPFTKQSFVTAGVSLNFMGHGLDIGYAVVLLAELRTSRNIHSDDGVISWIASTSTMAIIFGALTVSPIVQRYGRKPTNFISALIMTLAWFGLVLSNNIIILFILRFLQGFSMGFIGYVGAILIGEYTSPKHRGAFLSTITLTIVFGIFLSHTLGTFISRKESALVCAIIGILNLIVIYFSPETPSFLAMQHRYDECRKVFHWLRGFDEEEELEAMIKRDLASKEKDFKKTKKSGVKAKISLIMSNVKKKEFYKTIILLMTIDSWSVWFGIIIFDTYALDIYKIILNSDVNYAFVLISLGIQRVISNIFGIVIFRHMKRRMIFKITTVLMIFSLATIGLYAYGKRYELLPFDHPYIGIILLHLQYFSNAAGGFPFPNVILGEITPLQYREICGMVYLLFCSFNLTVTVKTAPMLFSTIGLHGTCFIYCGVILLSFILPWIMLPETKDKTLQEIEDIMFKDKSHINATDSIVSQPILL